MTISSSSTAINLTLINTFYLITGWTGNVYNSGTTPSSANSNIVINSAGIYQTLANISYIFGGNAHIYNFAIFVNGTQLSGHQASAEINNSNNFINNITISGIAQFNPGDVVDIRVKNVTAAGSTITVQNANFNVCVQGGVQGQTGPSNAILTNYNVFLGQNAGSSVTTANNNVGIGYNALSLLTTGLYNTAVGQCLNNTTTALNNIAIGNSAGNSISTGGGNTAIGGSSTSTGVTPLINGAGYNIGLGISSNVYIAQNAVNNIGLGCFSNLNTSTGCNNISIGTYTQALSATGCNNIVISTNGTSGVPISGRGENTALIDARSGLYTYVPYLQTYTAGGTIADIFVAVCLFTTTSGVASRGGTITYNNTYGTFLLPTTGVFEVCFYGYIINLSNITGVNAYIQVSTNSGGTWSTIFSQFFTASTGSGCCYLMANIDVQNATTMTRVSFGNVGFYAPPSGGVQYLTIKYISL
jgi:hypothetical protein